jgi:hypothetical protein
MAGTSAAADEHLPLPPHPHLLVLGAEVDLENRILLDARSCVHLAGGQALPLKAQHQHVHFGNAGEALLVNAGHLVIPAAPFPGVPWSSCEELFDFFDIG